MKKDTKGFTLMEMLIVVAIIAVLLTIVIPIFNDSIKKSRKAADEMNISAAFAEAAEKMLTTGKTGTAETTPLQSNGEKIVLQDGQTYTTEVGVRLKISVNTEGKISLDSSNK